MSTNNETANSGQKSGNWTISSALLEKGLIFLIMGISNFILYGWVSDNKTQDAIARRKLEQRVDNIEQRYEACQQYRYSEAYKLIEKVDRKLDAINNRVE